MGGDPAWPGSEPYPMIPRCERCHQVTHRGPSRGLCWRCCAADLSTAFGFSTGLSNALTHSGILGEHIPALTDDRLMGLRNVGIKRLAEFREKVPQPGGHRCLT